MWEEDQADEGTEVFDEEVETNPGKRLLWEAEHGELNAVSLWKPTPQWLRTPTIRDVCILGRSLAGLLIRIFRFARSSDHGKLRFIL